MTLPGGNPESNSASPVAPAEREFTQRGAQAERASAPPAEPSPVSPTFDVVTRARTKEIISLYPESRSALLPLLHLVQSVEGYVSQDGIRYCAEALGLTTAEVSAVATFYTMYKRNPCGEHLVSVCTNTLCAALGGDEIYDRLRTRLGTGDRPLGHEGTAGEPGTPGSVTLEHAECLAACDLAPVLQVNYEYYDNQTVDSAVELVDALRRGERPQPTRGAPLTDLRTVELELAGFTDDAAEVDTTARVEGPSSAIESVRGARLAEENGWAAPAMPDQPPAMPAAAEKR
ncbi:NADH-quinone oxidoreductase subunit NuoE [Pseudonocardia sp. HH130630-07]|uniref:NADH-quinone oxidoreductase subunit NuoE n=1 Tax=Pseudonocardia sp. HH130630-07 TaxID=1690815 RepID=UPI0008151D7E|nr:NADH-quinone oxidoreductase subunit NuoE [Pseudonocardia sp. HH130630-07]ANY07308.1 NADH dehydrogenase [Pseudonocardia sp. HH130630-07]